MPEPSRRLPFSRRLASWSLAWLFAAALYLLLIDITDLPELIVGVGRGRDRRHRVRARARAADRRRLASAPALAQARITGRCSSSPSDIVALSVLAFRQLIRPREVNGVFRAVPFRCGDDERLETGRRALAESLGSFAPNTIIVGVDAERELLLGHQLRRGGGDEAIDVLGLGSG